MNFHIVFEVIFLYTLNLLTYIKHSVSVAVCPGAVRLQTPLLLPRNRKLYEGSELACLMDHSGMLVTLPYDLRVSIKKQEVLHR